MDDGDGFLVRVVDQGTEQQATLVDGRGRVRERVQDGLGFLGEFWHGYFELRSVAQIVRSAGRHIVRAAGRGSFETGSAGLARAEVVAVGAATEPERGLRGLASVHDPANARPALA